MSRTLLLALLPAALAAAPAALAQTANPPMATAPAAPPAPEVGQMAPDFTAPWADASGERAAPMRLSDLRGKVVVLAFYPKDRTTGCTAELTKFRDEHASLFGSDVVVLPISVDSIPSHVAWASDMKFPFALVSDPTLAVADLYGSHTPGRPTSGRTVFVIGKDGRIAWREMRFNALSEDAYKALAAAVAAAQHDGHQGPKVTQGTPAGAMQHGDDHAASGWKEMDAFHQYMMQTWHPAQSSNDLRPIRAKAGAMADAARAWSAAAVPSACNTSETRATVAKVATESRALADLAAKPGSTDAEVKASLKALHDRFEVVEHGCHPGKPSGMKH